MTVTHFLLRKEVSSRPPTEGAAPFRERYSMRLSLSTANSRLLDKLPSHRQTLTDQQVAESLLHLGQLNILGKRVPDAAAGKSCPGRRFVLRAARGGLVPHWRRCSPCSLPLPSRCRRRSQGGGGLVCRTPGNIEAPTALAFPQIHPAR